MVPRSGEHDVLAEGSLMNVILLLALISLPAFSLSDSFLRMKTDPAYTQFLMTKYLGWHQKKFGFPVLSPLEKNLLGKIDHWLVAGSQELYQVTLGHREERLGRKKQSLRIWIHPDLRKEKEFSGSGLPSSGEPWFFERTNENSSCVILKTEEAVFDSWCRKTGDARFSWDHRERISSEHTRWNNPFILQLPTEIRIEDQNGEIIAVSYHKALTHISGVPRPLLQVVAAHTLESPFSMERYLIEKDGTMTIYYP